MLIVDFMSNVSLVHVLFSFRLRFVKISEMWPLLERHHLGSSSDILNLMPNGYRHAGVLHLVYFVYVLAPDMCASFLNLILRSPVAWWDSRFGI